MRRRVRAPSGGARLAPRRVNHRAADAQQLQPSPRDLKLRRVQLVAHSGRPARQHVRILSDGAVARAGHVGQHVVESHRAALRRTLLTPL
eukprot:3951973-Prymnesium_polylepis.1